MCINSKIVLLLKASVDDPNSSYSEAISSLGLNCVTLPSVTFEWTNLATLLSKLSQPEFFHGLVLTSQRSVDAVVECLKHEQNSQLILEHWKTKTVYVVGPATFRAAKRSLGIVGIGEESGNATALAKVILEGFRDHPERHKSLLFPCSSVKQETLPTVLLGNGVLLECVDCYQTKPHPEIKEMVLQLVKSKGTPLYLVFFSPSGVKSVIPALTQAEIPIQPLKLVSMGPSTTSCLASMGLVVAAEATKPDPEGLLLALRAITPHQLSTNHS